MNISPINSYQNSLQMKRTAGKNGISYSYEAKDSFQRQTPAFKGGIRTGAELLSKNPDLVKRFAEFMAVGFASFAGFKIVSDKISDSPNIPQEALELSKEIEALKKRNQELEQLLNRKEMELQDKKLQLANSTEAVNKNNTELVKVIFPKKMGRFTAEQEQLKKTITALPPLEKETAEALTGICSEIINAPKEDKEAKKQETIRLNEELQKAENDTHAINEVIKQFSAKNDEVLSGNEDLKPVIETPISDSEDDVFRIEAPKIMGPKIVKKINLEDKRPRIQASPEVTEIDSTRNLHRIVIPKGVNNPQNAIGALIKQTIEKVKEQNGASRVFMLQKIPVAYVKPQDVEAELIKQQEKGNPYKNITPEDAVEVANLISTGKFANMFCLHSAMRLIDRYVNLDDRNYSIEEQADKVLSAINKAILESMKQGLTFKPYKTIRTNNNQKDENGNPVEREYFSSKIFIDTNELSKDIQDTLGTIRINITFAQVNPKYTDTGTKGIISTIFSEGV